MKEIFIKTEFIKLGQLLKLIGKIDSGAEAKSFLLENKVLVNGERQDQRGKKIVDGFVIEIDNEKFLIKKNINNQ